MYPLAFLTFFGVAGALHYSYNCFSEFRHPCFSIHIYTHAPELRQAGLRVPMLEQEEIS